MNITKRIERESSKLASPGSLDANVLLRLLLNDVPDQHSAVVKLLEQTSGQFLVADTALIELVFVLGRHYQFSRKQIVEAVMGLLELTAIKCNEELFTMALPIFVKFPALSFEDCCLSAYANLQTAEPLWTFDQKLARQAANARLVATT
jgi:predicted nucleic-acid-binding protein